MDVVSHSYWAKEPTFWDDIVGKANFSTLFTHTLGHVTRRRWCMDNAVGPTYRPRVLIHAGKVHVHKCTRQIQTRVSDRRKQNTKSERKKKIIKRKIKQRKKSSGGKSDKLKSDFPRKIFLGRTEVQNRADPAFFSFGFLGKQTRLSAPPFFLFLCEGKFLFGIILS